MYVFLCYVYLLLYCPCHRYIHSLGLLTKHRRWPIWGSISVSMDGEISSSSELRSELQISTAIYGEKQENWQNGHNVH